jgi:hypothetical protein
MKRAFAAWLAGPTLALAQAADPQPDELLQLAFPKWKDEEGSRVVAIPTNAVTRAWDSKQGRTRNVIAAPRQVVRTVPDRIVLLAALTPAGDGGAPQVAHGTPLGLAAYTFQPGKDGWKLVRRQEPFDLQGFEGQAHMEVVPLSTSEQALHVTWGSCWQGRCVDLLALYALGADGVRAQPLVVQKFRGNNVYARPDCVHRLRELMPDIQPGEGGHEKVPAGPCYAIEGRWEIDIGGAAAHGRGAPGPLILHFTGAISKANGPVNLPAQRIDQKVTFEFRGGRYVPVSGNNPVPDA